MGPIVIVSPQKENWKDFADELGHRCRMDVIEVHSDAEAIDAARDKKPVIMIIDQDLDGQPGAGLVPQLLKIDAMIHTALVSDQPEEIFHDQTEGLGILMQLSPKPDRQEALRLSERLLGAI
jgi:DNA-binding NarL/FixJ family response regulator